MATEKGFDKTCRGPTYVIIDDMAPVTILGQCFQIENVDAALIKKDLGDRLLPCFDSLSDINLQSSKAHAPRWAPDSSTSEVSTIQLEFRDLSRATIDMSKCPEVLSWTEYAKKMPRTGEVVAEERHDHHITRNTVLRK